MTCLERMSSSSLRSDLYAILGCINQTSASLTSAWQARPCGPAPLQLHCLHHAPPARLHAFRQPSAPLYRHTHRIIRPMPTFLDAHALDDARYCNTTPDSPPPMRPPTALFSTLFTHAEYTDSGFGSHGALL